VQAIARGPTLFGIGDSVAWTEVVSALTSSVAVFVAVAVAVVEAVRASSARKQRDALLSEQKSWEHRATARLVSAWVEEDFVPSEQGTSYVRHVVAHIINGSDQPVFQVAPSVLVSPSVSEDSPPLTLGPLSIPPLMAVLPPQRELVFDLTIPLLPHRMENRGATPGTVGLELGFTDPNDTRWVRESDGRLVESAREVGRLTESTDAERAVRQLGRGDVDNPMAVTLKFLNIILDDELEDVDALRQLKDVLAPEAEGWRGLDENALHGLRAELHSYELGTHVSYPVPHVAYVKLLDAGVTDLSAVEGEGVVVPARIVTLTFHPGRGWRVFTYGGGGTEPDRIWFPPGTL